MKNNSELLPMIKEIIRTINLFYGYISYRNSVDYMKTWLDEIIKLLENVSSLQQGYLHDLECESTHCDEYHTKLNEFESPLKTIRGILESTDYDRHPNISFYLYISRILKDTPKSKKTWLEINGSINTLTEEYRTRGCQI